MSYSQDLERQLWEVTQSAKQARRELRDYHEKHTQFRANNRSQQKLDELLFSTREIEKHVVRALRADDRRQRRTRREEQRMPSHTSITSQPGVVEGGRNPPPSPPPDSPSELGIGPSGPRSPGPGPLPGNMRGDEGGSIISIARPPQAPTSADGVLQEELIEEGRSRGLLHASFEELNQAPEPLGLTKAELLGMIDEKFRSMEHTRTSVEKQRHTSVPSPPLTVPPAEEFLGDKPVEGVQPVVSFRELPIKSPSEDRRTSRERQRGEKKEENRKPKEKDKGKLSFGYWPSVLHPRASSPRSC